MPDDGANNGGRRRNPTRRAAATGLAGAAVGALLAPRLAAAAEFAAPSIVRSAVRPKLHFAFYTDVHARTEWGTPKAMMKAADFINREKPEIVVGGGDFITDGFQSRYQDVAARWDVYMEMHRAIKAPNFPTIGNHDLVAANPEDGSLPDPDPKRVYREKLGLEREYFSFDAGGYHFVALDTMKVVFGKDQYHGFVDPVQLDWLRSDLARVDKGTPIVASVHIPLATLFFQMTEGPGAPNPPNRVTVNAPDVLRAFSGHNLVLVLQGHLHVIEAMHWRGTTFLTGGAICASWWRGSWHGTEEGYCVIDLDGDKVTWRYVDYGWDAVRPPGQ